jgi:ferredoxin
MSDSKKTVTKKPVKNKNGPAKSKLTKSKPVLSLKKRQSQRREFLRSSLLAVGVVSLSLAGLLPVVRGHSARLRPPGALKTTLDEQEFFAACIKCGQCVQVCPEAETGKDAECAGRYNIPAIVRCFYSIFRHDAFFMCS